MNLSDLITKLQDLRDSKEGASNLWTFVQAFDAEDNLVIQTVYDVWIDDDGDVCIGKKDQD